MNTLPTISECNLWILDQCQTILCYIEKGNFDIKDIVQTTFESTQLLIHALDISQRDKCRLLNKLEKYAKFKQNQSMIKMLVSRGEGQVAGFVSHAKEPLSKVINIREICNQVSLQSRYFSTTTTATSKSNYGRETERILFKHVDYSTIWPDQIDDKACWFRNYFVGKPYVTFIGPISEDESDLAIVSIVKETMKKASAQYRMIVRTKQASVWATLHSSLLLLLMRIQSHRTGTWGLW